jgi:hypothetical protein
MSCVHCSGLKAVLIGSFLTYVVKTMVITLRLQKYDINARQDRNAYLHIRCCSLFVPKQTWTVQFVVKTLQPHHYSMGNIDGFTWCGHNIVIIT